jgi:hypothetical protein
VKGFSALRVRIGVTKLSLIQIRIMIKAITLLLLTAVWLSPLSAQPLNWELERMPADLETDFALSSLPPHLRNDASVFLLDPQKGYFMARKGTNGFMCFVLRTEWEHDDYRQDLFSPISFDAEGARVIFVVYRDVAAMRATGKVTASALKDSIGARFRKGVYKAPRPGISYMLSPIMRTYDASYTVVTMSVPHHMFYAPYLTAADLGCSSEAADGGLVMIGEKTPHACGVLFAGEKEKAKILESHTQLLKRLAEYKPYLRVAPKS